MSSLYAKTLKLWAWCVPVFIYIFFYFFHLHCKVLAHKFYKEFIRFIWTLHAWLQCKLYDIFNPIVHSHCYHTEPWWSSSSCIPQLSLTHSLTSAVGFVCLFFLCRSLKFFCVDNHVAGKRQCFPFFLFVCLLSPLFPYCFD